MVEPPHPVIAQEFVRHVGDIVAVVIAETKEQAREAAEALNIDYGVMPAAVSLKEAVKPGAPRSGNRPRATSATTGAWATRPRPTPPSPRPTRSPRSTWSTTA